MLCTCDKMGAPWVVEAAMAVIKIIHCVCLKIGQGATLHHETPNNSRPFLIIYSFTNQPIVFKISFHTKRLHVTFFL